MNTATATTNATTNLTALEIDALCAIVTSEYQDCDPSDFESLSAVWSASLAGTGDLTVRNIAGVVSSLAKKGLTVSQGTGKEQTVSLTAAGHVAYLASC